MTPSESRANDQVVRVCCRCSSKPAQKVPRSFQLFTTVQRWRQRFDFEWLRSLPRIYHNIKYTWNKIMFLTAFISICLRCAEVWAAQIEQVCVQPLPSAVDMTLPVFTPECRGSVLWRRCWWAPTPAVDRYLLSAAGALSSKPAVRTRSMGQTDGQTDDAQPFHTPFLRPHTMRGCVSKIIAARSILIPRQMCEQLNGPYTLLVFTSRVPISVALVFLVKLFRVKAVEVNRIIIPKIKKKNDTRKYRISCLRYALLPHSVQPPVP